MHLLNVQERDAAACLAVETEIESLFRFSSGRNRCICRAKARRCNITSKLCTYAHRHAGDAFKDCETQMELKALESCRLCFVYKSRVQFHLSAYSSMPLESSGCGFERQKQQRRPDLMVT